MGHSSSESDVKTSHFDWDCRKIQKETRHNAISLELHTDIQMKMYYRRATFGQITLTVYYAADLSLHTKGPKKRGESA